MSDVGLHQLNRMPLAAALKALGACCGSSSWCFKMASGRPYPSRSELLRFAELKFRSLTKDEWREAFAHHPPIGVKFAKDTSFSDEQRKVLEESCNQYQRRFGHVFIIRSADMRPIEILSQLSRRLRYDPYDELYVAGQHQGKITKDNLLVLLDELARGAEDAPLWPDMTAPVAETDDSAYLKARGRSVAASTDLSKKTA